MRLSVLSLALAGVLVLTACTSQKTRDQNAAADDQATAAVAPLATAAADAGSPAAAIATAKPSFDCTKATLKVETAICNDASMAELDVEVTRIYDLIGRAPGVDRGGLQRLQGGWLNKRNACATAKNMRACLLDAYGTRIADLRNGYPVARDDTTVSIGPISWHCPKGDITSTFINSESSMVYVKSGTTGVMLTQSMSASGARYEGGGYEFWTKGNETIWTTPTADMVTCTEIP